jgi:hypothetical protein
MSRATICSISELDWYMTRSYGHFHIPACPKGQPYILVFIPDQTDRFSLGEDKYSPFPIDGRDVARDLVGYHEPGNSLENEGVFVCAGDKPTPEELQQAHEKRIEAARQRVMMGDSIWARYKDPRMVPDHCRRAVALLGEDREWAYKVQKKAPCPACGEPVLEGVALCKSCGAILDREKAIRYGLLQPTSAEATAGRPEPTAATTGPGPDAAHRKDRR